MTLPPFQENATCPKCGHDDVRTAYVWQHRAWSTPDCGATYETFKYREHLDRSCQRCHFVWPEAVLEPLPAPQRAAANEQGEGGTDA